MKTCALSRRALEYLVDELGYSFEGCLSDLIDSPYLFIDEFGMKITGLSTNSAYRSLTCPVYTEAQILRLRPVALSAESPNKLLVKLCDLLNSDKQERLRGYECVFQVRKYWVGGCLQEFIFPVSCNSCGGITMVDAALIIEFCGKNDLTAYFTHFDYKGGKERFGTYNSCVTFY